MHYPKIPKSIEKQIDWKLEYEKNIKANQKVLDLDFDKIDDLLSIGKQNGTDKFGFG